MAIQDDKNYVLTGAMLKDLADRILDAYDSPMTLDELTSALESKQETLTPGDNISIDANNVIDVLGDTVPTLTYEDYNYPVAPETPTAIALWKLNPGLYKIAAGTSVRSDSSTLLPNASAIRYALITADENGNTVEFYSANGGGWEENRVNTTSGVATSFAVGTNHQRLLIANDIIDNLNSASGLNPLSANQGRVLNNKIGDLSALHTEDKTSVVSAMNELDARGDGVITKSDGAPTSETEGEIGQLVEDVLNGELYQLQSIESGVYNWVKVGAEEIVSMEDWNNLFDNTVIENVNGVGL